MKMINELRNVHQGETITINLCGPSLLNWDISHFKNRILIGVNSSPLFFQVDYWLMIDKKSWRINHSKIAGKKIIVPISWFQNKEHKDPFDLLNDLDVFYFQSYSQGWHDGNLIDKHFGIWGDGSFTASISFAAWLGAKRMEVFGADFGPKNGKIYWNMDYTDGADERAEKRLIGLLDQKEEVDCWLKNQGISIRYYS